MLTTSGEMINEFAVPCPDCGAQTGTQCLNSVTGLPLRRAAAHAGRIRDAVKRRKGQNE